MINETITSATNPKLKYIIGLQQRKNRDKEHVFILEGLRNAEMAVNATAKIKMCFCTKDILAQARGKQLIEKLSCPIYEISDHLYAKISDTKSPQGLMLIIEQNNKKLNEILASKSKSLYLILDRLQDPGNLGTIIRTADAMGISGIICLKGTADIFSPKVVRATMGSLFNLPIAIKIDEAELLSFAQDNALNLYATSLDQTAKPLWHTQFATKSAIILGNEANGISPKLLNNSQNKIYIPMSGNAESLNVATAAAMIIYEYTRQII